MVVRSQTMQTRFAAGEERALEECRARFDPMLLAYCRRYVGPDDAEDVVQQVMVEAWRGRARYDPARPLEAWLLAIARRRAIDTLRARRAAVVDVEALRELSGEDGRDRADRFAWAYEVREALSQLPEVQREALILAYFGGMSQSQIAIQLEVPLGTVKTRTARAMDRMAELLDSGGGE